MYDSATGWSVMSLRVLVGAVFLLQVHVCPPPVGRAPRAHTESLPLSVRGCAHSGRSQRAAAWTLA
jgi:hypothetical protein